MGSVRVKAAGGTLHGVLEYSKALGLRPERQNSCRDLGLVDVEDFAVKKKEQIDLENGKDWLGLIPSTIPPNCLSVIRAAHTFYDTYASSLSAPYYLDWLNMGFLFFHFGIAAPVG